MSGKHKNQERINEFFENYPKEDVAVVASDGQIFQKKAEQWASKHAKRNGLKLVEVERPSEEKENGSDPSDSTPNIDKLKKDDLIAFAEENEIEIDKDATNKVLRKQIKEHLNSNFDPDQVDDEDAEAGAEDGKESKDEGEGSGEEFTPTNNDEK